ncbi:Rieske (2Fe-2S) protein [Paractinoplanes brasiliensis]|uniref:Nitrite reductase (NADH) small subunit n=1 Tax=Paractinoplanes brasiliensis TaxID=52695 RepID=A0A4R6JCB7_9ACTN|nr:Rieske 2Fe-2S domain-containing protein [Actinoplanes brasiliensis]TDO32176.1 nitrite reductase (NADH) small subunit [Actinoplanes brasiliensis]GID28229.1 assimilatory nitrite reductase [NAD(P)H] small subunit [Actinoplanes brasiliensis]
MRAIGLVDEIPLGEGRTFTVDGEMIAVFRLRDGSLRATQAVCPHKGGPLADGQIDLKQVLCPLHLNAWDLRTGCSLSGQPDLTTYPVHLDDNTILLGDPT